MCAFKQDHQTALLITTILVKFKIGHEASNWYLLSFLRRETAAARLSFPVAPTSLDCPDSRVTDLFFLDPSLFLFLPLDVAYVRCHLNNPKQGAIAVGEDRQMLECDSCFRNNSFKIRLKYCLDRGLSPSPRIMTTQGLYVWCLQVRFGLHFHHY